MGMFLIVVTAIAEVFMLYIHWIFAEKVMTSRGRTPWSEVAAWLLYFIAYNFVVYVISQNAWTNLLIFFGFFYLLFTYLYQDSVAYKVYIIAVMYLTGMCSELMIYSAFYFIRIYQEEFFLGVIASKLVWFCLLKFILLFMKKDRKRDSGFWDWLEAVFVPIGCIVVFFIFLPMDRFFERSIVLKKAAEVLGIVILLIINIVSYYLYEKGKEVAEKRMHEKALQEQCNYYMRQCEESKALWMELSKFRHDMKQKYIYLQILLEAGEYQELERYCKENLEFLSAGKSVASSGNIFFDSILNYKAEIADSDAISFRTSLEIPHDCHICGEEISICLGNLLDNAIEAVRVVEQKERWISVRISVQGSNLFLEIKNPYDGLRRRKGAEYRTTKPDVRSHGWGLQIIREIVEQHHGQMELSEKEKIFCVKLLLYDAVS